MAGAVLAALESAAAALTPRIRNHARELGWPEEVADSLTLQVHDGEIRAAWPSSMNRRVMDLEFGTQERAPRAAIGTFYTRPDYEKHMRTEALNKMTPILRRIDKALR